MKWFKHMVGSKDDPDLVVALDEFGPAGPHVFWTVMEFYASEFDHYRPGHDGWLKVSWTDFHRKSGVKGSKLDRIMNFLSECKTGNGEGLPRIMWRRDKGYIWLKVPKFIELADEYTQKRLAREEKKRRESVGTMSGIEVEGEEEREGEGEEKDQTLSKIEADLNRILESDVIAEEIKVFLSIVTQYPERFEVDVMRDADWFQRSVLGAKVSMGLNVREEVERWGNWLEAEWRKLGKGKKSYFPKSDFKSSLLNRLKKSQEKEMKKVVKDSDYLRPEEVFA